MAQKSLDPLSDQQDEVMEGKAREVELGQDRAQALTPTLTEPEAQIFLLSEGRG